MTVASQQRASAGTRRELPTATRVVRRTVTPGAQTVTGDLCVTGAGIAGVSAALEAARLGRKVVLADGLPALGGQAVHAIIGTFAGLYSNGPRPYRLTHRIADDILRDLEARGAVHYKRRPTTITVLYDEVALARWMEEAVRAAGITVILGAILREVERDGRRLRSLLFATRYGDVRVRAQGFVDATGDAAVAWHAGLPCREPATATIYGTQMVVLEGIDEAHHPDEAELAGRLQERAEEYGLIRTAGFSFAFPGRGTTLVNLTHVETPLEPVAASATALEGKAQADRVIAFLKGEFPRAFGEARARSYGLPGIRQTRWIAGTYQLTLDDVRSGRRFRDAVARTSWPIELHDSAEGFYWETLGDDHVHFVPLRSMVPPEADNLVAAGRCIDGDVAALSSVRVMGPCIAMGVAAAHALDLAGAGSVHEIDTAVLAERLRDNLERTD